MIGDSANKKIANAGIPRFALSASASACAFVELKMRKI